MLVLVCVKYGIVRLHDVHIMQCGIMKTLTFKCSIFLFLVVTANSTASITLTSITSLPSLSFDPVAVAVAVAVAVDVAVAVAVDVAVAVAVATRDLWRPGRHSPSNLVSSSTSEQ